MTDSKELMNFIEANDQTAEEILRKAPEMMKKINLGKEDSLFIFGSAFLQVALTILKAQNLDDPKIANMVMMILDSINNEENKKNDA